VTLPETGHTFKTKIDVLEALGSDYYAHFTVASEPVASSELEELLEDTDPAGVAPGTEGVQFVARLAAGSGVRQGQRAELWVDTSQLHLFDPDTGLSLLSSDLSRAGRSSAAQAAPSL
jgi:multiple sugar transport system ATP-binding protein